MKEINILDESPSILGEILRFTGEDEDMVLYHVEIPVEVFEYYLNLYGLTPQSEIDWVFHAQEIIVEVQYGTDDYYSDYVSVAKKRQKGWVFFPVKGNPISKCISYVRCPKMFLIKNNKIATKEHKYTHFAPLF